jgi:Fe2+ transport system protein FeoA
LAVSVSKRTLADLRRGERSRVVSISGAGQIQQRMLEMGVSPGADIEVLRSAPLGDPIEVHVRGFNLMLRLQEAALVQVEDAS